MGQIFPDEAHCISEWGHDFRPDYSLIAEFRELLGNPLTIALTATATPDVQSDVIKRNEIDAVRGLGLNYIREKMSFKDRNDYRVETVLAMLNRYGVTEGSFEEKNIAVLGELPEALSEENQLKEKLMNDNKKLLSVVK